MAPGSTYPGCRHRHDDELEVLALALVSDARGGASQLVPTGTGQLCPRRHLPAHRGHPGPVEGDNSHIGVSAWDVTLAEAGGWMTRVESSVTALSWIPRDAMEGMGKLAADLGVSHWDLPPPDQLDNLDDLIAADAIRLANELRAWIEVEDGQISSYGQLGQGRIGRTTLRAGPRQVLFPAVAFPDLRPAPKVGASWVRFVQTAGGRTGAPLPRRVRRAPFVQLAAPTAWSTLALTIHADGSSQHEVVGASPFPRHWIYNDRGQLVAKTGLIDFNRWRRGAFGRHTPWGDEESPALGNRRRDSPRAPALSPRHRCGSDLPQAQAGRNLD
jgi:hypothetical protein